ncbi:MAG TPA: 3-hydroxyacyl-CoA dehydrogenase [Rhodospirillaceae bacterium]|nr:3-hydroxyacyl-CoA dehydrogenase [Rhodospirillaceae bacterium]
MPSEIRKVAVIGSGVMGSQIAAQVANAGVPVFLFDIVPQDADDRNVMAKKALERMMGRGSPFMHPSAAAFITPANLEDDLQKIAECDWIVEVVLENPKIKSDLYKKVDSVRKAGSIVSSNTSTIPLANLISDQSEGFAKDFMITHFFNPVRYMRLLELITGPQTSPESRVLMADFCDRKLGKGVVPCNDTPGFIANRLGMFWLQSAVNAAMDLGLTVEEADAVCGRPMGIPRTGVFGLIDLIGLDLMPLIGQSLLSTLEPDDVYRNIYQEPELFKKMIADGYTGRKGKGGYYRVLKTEAGKSKESINLETGTYGPSSSPKIPTLEAAGNDLRAICEADDKIGQFAWRVVSETLSYAFVLVPDTVADVTLVDDGMKMGYNWKFGPFELLDKVGADWFMEKLKSESREVPALLEKAAGKSFYRIDGGKRQFLQLDGTYADVPRAEGVLLLSDIKIGSQPVEKSASASLWDIGDGVLCLSFNTKAHIVDDGVLDMLNKTRELIGDGNGKWKGLVIHNEGIFSAGANLASFRDSIKAGKFDEIDAYIKKGQDTYSKLRFAPFPSVAATSGSALGGGCELTLHCSAVQSYCEFAIGLVELGVGLIPGWGGCTQMLGRAAEAAKGCGCGCDDAPPVNKVFELISTMRVSSSAADAMALGFLRKSDGISMNSDRLLFDGKKKVLELAQGYTPPASRTVDLPGPAGKAALELILEAAKPSPHDTTIGTMFARVLCAEENGVSEQKLMDIERELFVDLAKMPETLARIEHMLAKGKVLKN